MFQSSGLGAAALGHRWAAGWQVEPPPGEESLCLKITAHHLYIPFLYLWNSPFWQSGWAQDMHFPNFLCGQGQTAASHCPVIVAAKGAEGEASVMSKWAQCRGRHVTSALRSNSRRSSGGECLVHHSRSGQPHAVCTQVGGEIWGTVVDPVSLGCEQLTATNI